MVILKKIKGSSIMETLVATVLIIVIFMVSSMILNNVFSNTIRNNTRPITSHLCELEYLYSSGKLAVPYQDDYLGWNISITEEQQEQQKFIQLSAFHPLTNKTVVITTYN
ncbi:hypothetical protein [Psychroserpens sp. SPM9]|uniref:hypothetical protein n=1 Tax=Psychroserpens sp. SPM9 TaxID=2975598 RepID=UPI0021A4F98D|nr:hypothetical protein [Psychroserpens sp. SPM9]MDG5490651.1 hypothetical protein [Psychroserpens sp. SPM9]